MNTIDLNGEVAIVTGGAQGIGLAVAKRAAAFEMKLVGFDPYWDEEFASKYGVERKSQAEDVLKVADIVGLHLNLSEKNLHFLNRDRLAMLQPGSVVINTSRGGLVDQEAMAEAIKSGHLGGYGADVVEPEPIRPDNPLIGLDRVVLTPHIGSRTYESVGRQAMMATKNLIQVLNGEAAVAQANQV